MSFWSLCRVWNTTALLCACHGYTEAVRDEEYDTYAKNCYDFRRVETINLKFKIFVGQSLKDIEHPVLLTEWTINNDKDAYKEKLKKKHINRPKKNNHNIGLRILGIILCGFYSRMSRVIRQII